jgi:hypothetical protein
MNPSSTPDNTEAARLEKLREQISTDMEAMQQKEASLREYEQRLRLLVEHAHGSQSPKNASQFHVTSGPSRADLDAEWEKYERAHALLEAARRGLSDDRLALKEREEQVMIREQEVARREAWVKVREQELAAKAMAEVPPPPKAKATFTTAPFLAAKNLLSIGKGH